MKYYSLALAFFFYVATISSKQAFEVVTFFLREYPEATNNSNTKEESAQYAGIPTIYGGFITISDNNGQVIVPRLSQKSALNILVAKDIKPTFINKGTIKNWKITGPAEMYSLKRKQNKETRSDLWFVKKSKSSPKTVPLHTIIILADPQYIYIPTGATPTQKGAQLYLPDIYVKDGIETVKDAIFATRIRSYYSPILKQYKGVPQGFETVIKSLT